MIVPGYYENFVRRVLDNHVQGIEANLEKEPETKVSNPPPRWAPCQC